LEEVVEAAINACFKSWLIDNGKSAAVVDELKEALDKIEIIEIMEILKRKIELGLKKGE